MAHRVPPQYEQITRARERKEGEMQVEYLVPWVLSFILGAVFAAVVFAVTAILRLPRAVSIGAAGIAFGLLAPMLVQRALRRKPEWMDRGLEDDDRGHTGSPRLPNEEL